MSSKTFQDLPEFRCPVCRAKQARQAECRRCRADLTLVVQAHGRTEHLITAWHRAEETGDAPTQSLIREELKRLAPGVLRRG